MNLTLKYTSDKFLTIVLIIFLSPLFIFIALAMGVEALFRPDARGPLFHSEDRISCGKSFKIYKFRVLKKSICNNLKVGESVWRYQWNRKNLTMTGRLLILCYLDELPQFMNILRGEMTLVGPRPKTKPEYELHLKKGYVALKYLKGGLTGLHQIHKGTPKFSMKLSERYLRKCRTLHPIGLLFFDLAILFRSLLKALKAEGL